MKQTQTILYTLMNLYYHNKQLTNSQYRLRYQCFYDNGEEIFYTLSTGTFTTAFRSW